MIGILKRRKGLFENSLTQQQQSKESSSSQNLIGLSFLKIPNLQVPSISHFTEERNVMCDELCRELLVNDRQGRSNEAIKGSYAQIHMIE